MLINDESTRMLETAAMYQKLYSEAQEEIKDLKNKLNPSKVYILWQAWDSWQIHSVYFSKKDAEEKKESLMKREAPYCYMGYQIEERVMN